MFPYNFNFKNWPTNYSALQYFSCHVIPQTVFGSITTYTAPNGQFWDRTVYLWEGTDVCELSLKKETLFQISTSSTFHINHCPTFGWSRATTNLYTRKIFLIIRSRDVKVDLWYIWTFRASLLAVGGTSGLGRKGTRGTGSTSLGIIPRLELWVSATGSGTVLSESRWPIQAPRRILCNLANTWSTAVSGSCIIRPYKSTVPYGSSWLRSIGLIGFVDRRGDASTPPTVEL